MPNTQNTRSQVIPPTREHRAIASLVASGKFTSDGAKAIAARVTAYDDSAEVLTQEVLTQDSIDRRDNLVALINTYNDSSSPSVARTDDEHAVERLRARTALNSIKRNYIEGRDYRELSSGALWPVDGGSR